MNINTAFPSKFVRVADLQNRRVTVTIERVTMEDMGDGDSKPVIYFIGSQKGLAANKTNAMEIAMAFGEETDHWAGKQIELFPASTMYQGRNTPCIRVRAIYPAAGTGLSNAPVQPQPLPPSAPMAHPMQAPFNAGPGERAAGGADPFADSDIPF